MPAPRLLYYITDRAQFSGDEPARRRALLGKITEAAKAGVDYIQLREKDLRTTDLEALAHEAVAAVRSSAQHQGGNGANRTRILINSRTDVALAVEADGVHLRDGDLSPNEVREMVKLSSRQSVPGFLTAVSCHSVREVQIAESAGANFVVFAPVFEKRNSAAAPSGPDELAKACRANIPVFALGGITAANAGACFRAGASGVAGIRLFQDNKIEDIVRTLRAL
jgi:thiamine-phosphate pyrophosphorylase